MRNGRVLATSSADNAVKVWDFAGGAQRKAIGGFEKEVTSVRFVGDGDVILATAGDSKVRLVKADGADVRTLPAPRGFVYAAAASRDGAVVVAGGEDGVLRVWEAATGKVLAEFPPPPPR
jgi:WD40 repeat protein